MAAGACLLVVTGALTALRPDPPLPQLYTAGVARAADGSLAPVPPLTRGRFVSGTNVLAGPGADPVAVAESRRWLGKGTVPGASGPFGSMGSQALLDVRAMTEPNGAVIAGWTDRWHYVWPRDAAFAIAALCATGHPDDGYRALRYLVSVAPHDGLWQARYLPDGSGDVPDGRGIQRDGSGWFLWGAWYWYVSQPPRAGAATAVRAGGLWDAVHASAEALTLSLDENGLPPVSSDYWERDEDMLTLGVALPALLGLRSAADLARRLGHPADSARWGAAATLLEGAIHRVFGPQGYPRTVSGGPDAAITLLRRPFLGSGAKGADVRAAAAALRVPNGGLRPGVDWKQDGIAWTPETALFALSFVANGHRAEAERLLAWLDTHRTQLGSLPEKVLPNGRPAAVAPLTWTAAIVVLALTAQEHPLAMPPLPTPTPLPAAPA